MAKYVKKSNEEKRAEINEVLAKLEEGVKGVFTSDKYREYLKFFSKFHNYSFNNVIMILQQYPEASRVASFKTWNELGFKVKKGSKGIKVLVPIPYKYKAAKVVKDSKNNPKLDENGKQIVEIVDAEGLRFKLGNVFDISQVDGGDIPKLTSAIEDNPESVEKLVEALIVDSDVEIKYDPTLSQKSAYGYYSLLDKSIYLREDMKSIHKLKTLIHEKAHSMLHDKIQNGYTREEAEVQAESTAFVVCNCLGLDTSEYSFGYIASWSSNKNLDELKSSLKVIADTSNELLNWVEKVSNKVLGNQ